MNIIIASLLLKQAVYKYRVSAFSNLCGYLNILNTLMIMASSISSTTDIVPHLLGDKLPPTVSTLLCSQCNLPLIEPRQPSCGYRICGNCFSSLNER